MFENESRGFRRGYWMLGAAFVAGLSIAGTDATQTPDSWIIDSGPIHHGRYFADTVANGMIGIQVMPEPFRTQQTIIYGAYERMWPGSVTSTVRSFNFLNLAVKIDGTAIDHLEQTTFFHQTVDMKHAQVTTAFDYEDKATIIYSVRALRQLPHTALMDVTIKVNRPLTLEASTIMESPIASGADPFNPARTFPWLSHVEYHQSGLEEDVKPSYLRLRAAASAQGPTGSPWIAAAQSFIFDEPESSAPAVVAKDGMLTYNHRLAAPGTYHFALVGASLTSSHVDDPLNEAQRLTASAALQGTARLIEGHERAWAKLWKSDIVIEGDPVVQRTVHSMLYHLYSFIREGTGYSISPMGLTGGPDDYLGHIFWDAEAWMFPPLLALHPELARSMLDYRYERLGAARKNASMSGYRGASFPWESAATGDEDVWSDAMGAPEIHVTAVIALAAWDYFRVTQDRGWLRERGYPILKETADYWASRVARNGPGHYDITHVVAADEYAENVDNDAFTNAAARLNLQAAGAAARILGIAQDPEWAEVERNIPILQLPSGVTREHSSYEGQKIKQADVNLLAYPLGIVTEPRAVQRDLEYYASRNDDAEGPAMTKSIFTILYERLGMPERALRIFKSGYEPNQRPPFGLLAESPVSDNPYFATGAGGLLQAVIYGFGGMEITDRGFTQRPTKLPPGWRRLILTSVGPESRQFSVP